MVRTGDEVVTIPPLWHHGEDIGDRLGRVINTHGYILVELYNYYDNPVKCFRREVEVVGRRTTDDELMEEINIAFDNIYAD